MKNFIIITMLIASTLVNAQAKITGVVTYYFNEYQGDKADIGAKVYVIDSSKVDQKDLNILRLYFKTKTLQNEWLRLKSDSLTYSISYTSAKLYAPKDADDYYSPRLKNIQADMDDVKSQFKKFGFDNYREISYLDSRAKAIKDIIQANATIIKTIDATGSYSSNLKPNRYFVLIKSNNRHSLTSTELDGDVFLKGINIIALNELDVSYNFNIK